MTSVALLRHLAFGLGLALLSALVVRAMIALRVMDTPEERKAHDRPIPKGGGVGVVAAFLVGVVLLYHFAEFARLANEYFVGVIGAAMFLGDSVITPAISVLSAVEGLKLSPAGRKRLSGPTSADQRRADILKAYAGLKGRK